MALQSTLFTVPEDALKHFRLAVERGRLNQKKWQDSLKSYSQAYPEEARQLLEDIEGKLPEGWDSELSGLFKSGDKPMATREASGKIINIIARKIPGIRRRFGRPGTFNQDQSQRFW